MAKVSKDIIRKILKKYGVPEEKLLKAVKMEIKKYEESDVDIVEEEYQGNMKNFIEAMAAAMQKREWRGMEIPVFIYEENLKYYSRKYGVPKESLNEAVATTLAMLNKLPDNEVRLRKIFDSEAKKLKELA